MDFMMVPMAVLISCAMVVVVTPDTVVTTTALVVIVASIMVGVIRALMASNSRMKGSALEVVMVIM